MSYTPKRTQYPFDLSGVKFKTRGEIINLERQWNTFERVENYDDIVYQKLAVGNRGQLYYQFLSQQESKDYKVGQISHINRYPWLPPTTFNSLRNKPFPLASTIQSTFVSSLTSAAVLTYTSTIFQVPSVTGIPFISSQPRMSAAPTQTQSEYLSKMADLQTYMYVSSYNSEHTYKYQFTSDEQKMAYYRAERQILAPSYMK